MKYELSVRSLTNEKFVPASDAITAELLYQLGRLNSADNRQILIRATYDLVRERNRALREQQSTCRLALLKK